MKEHVQSVLTTVGTGKRRAFGLLAIGTGVLALLPIFMNAPLLGWDWFYGYIRNLPSEIYTPWIDWVLWPVRALPWRTGLAVTNGVTVMVVAVLTLLEGRTTWKYLGVILALANPPIWFILWDGQADAWGLVGLLAMPIGLPLVLMKPTMIAFVVLARKRWVLLSVGFGLLTILIWGWWPGKLLSTLDQRVGHPSPMGWMIQGIYLLVIGLVLLLFTDRQDPYQYLAAGAFLYPFVMPYHFIALLPALGRLTNLRQLALWLLSWTLLLEVGVGGIWKDIAYLFPLFAWYWLRSPQWFERSWFYWLLPGRYKPVFPAPQPVEW
jgi:hypothetical protein